MRMSDCNDIAPEFTDDGFYTFTVNEGVTSGAVVGNSIAITDGDTTPSFKASTFSIVGGADQTMGWLEISTTDNINVS